MVEGGLLDIRLISADDHVVEPPTLWTDRLPARYADRAPRVIRDKVRTRGVEDLQFSFEIGAADGRVGDIWAYEDVRVPQFRLNAAVGFDREHMGLIPITYEEMRPGCFVQSARLEDMDINGVESSLCFPNTFVRFCGQVFLEAKDHELALACVRAYNDWVIDEWFGGSDGRLIPLCLIPLWDPQLAAEEVRRNAARGCHAVAFSELPTYLGLPSIHSGHWEPFFAACAETATVICIHIGSGSRLAATSDDAPPGVMNTLTFVNSVMSVTDWLMSGLFVQYPDLRVCFAECQIGWLPYVLERADQGWEVMRHILPEPPSHYFRRNVYACFFDDAHGIVSLDEIGADRVVFETDYPHKDSTWPNSQSIAKQIVSTLDPSTASMILRNNAIEMLRLDESGRAR